MIGNIARFVKIFQMWSVTSLQQRLVLTGEDLLGVPGGHGYSYYSRSAREPQPVGDRCGRTPRNVDTVESHRNGPQPSMRHDDDDDGRPLYGQKIIILP